MLALRLQATGCTVFLSLLLSSPNSGAVDTPPPTSKSRIEAALENIMILDRPGQDGFATIWDGADSDQFARLFRSHLARDSELMSPRVPISNRPGDAVLPVR
jgi:hypothetical protein